MSRIETVNEKGHPVVSGDVALKIMEGNWWKFPPPSQGVYDVRQRTGVGRYTVYQNAPVDKRHSKKGGHICMGMICETTMKLAGYEFRFPLVGMRQNVFMPYKVLYRTQVEPDGRKHVEFAGRESLLHRLPVARSIEEARYIVARLTEIWPEFNGQHIEYMEQQL